MSGVRLDGIFNTMASALSAESIRMNTTASNLANAGSTGGSDSTTYHAKHPVFSTIQQELSGGLNQDEQLAGGVRVVDVIQSQQPLQSQFDPSNPLADENGRVYITDVNPIAEMTNMIAASKEYQADVEVMNTTKSLLLQTIHAMNN